MHHENWCRIRFVVISSHESLDDDERAAGGEGGMRGDGDLVAPGDNNARGTMSTITRCHDVSGDDTTTVHVITW